jgi:hypothetical protein
MPDQLTPGQKAARARKRRASAVKAAKTRKRRAAGPRTGRGMRAQIVIVSSLLIVGCAPSKHRPPSAGESFRVANETHSSC